MYASLLTSLLAAFFAMLGKQWLNRYLRNAGGSMIERCRDRQRKCDGLAKWSFHLFIGSPPAMLQLSLLLLACGLCRRMWSINIAIARVLIAPTAIGVLFYLTTAVAGMLSYACPFQTPASIALQGLWKKVQRRFISVIPRWKEAISLTRRARNRRIWQLLRHQSPPITPPESARVQQPEPWLTPKDLAIIQWANADDVRCVSWVLGNIIDPEALDTAIRFAATIRWFEDGINVEPPYDLIVSTLEACFDPTATLHPGLGDRAYHSYGFTFERDAYPKSSRVDFLFQPSVAIPHLLIMTSLISSGSTEVWILRMSSLGCIELLQDLPPRTCNGLQTHFYSCRGLTGMYLMHLTRSAVIQTKEIGTTFH